MQASAATGRKSIEGTRWRSTKAILAECNGQCRQALELLQGPRRIVMSKTFRIVGAQRAFTAQSAACQNSGWKSMGLRLADCVTGASCGSTDDRYNQSFAAASGGIAF